MSLYVLDTDTLSLYQHGHASIRSRMPSPLARGELAITVLTVEEQSCRAGSPAVRTARQPDQLARAYQELADAVQILSRWPILSVFSDRRSPGMINWLP